MKKDKKFHCSDKNTAYILHKESIVIDAFTTIRFPDNNTDYSYFQKMIDSGLSATIICITDPSDTIIDFLKKIIRWHKIIEKNNNVLLALNPIDIEKSKEEKKVAIIFGTQHPNSISDDIDLLDLLYELGLRMFGLVYQRRGFIGDGCGELTNCGLSKFGMKVIEKMNELGMLIDLSHAGYKTTMEGIEISKDPVIFSHTYPRGLNDFMRNKSDEQIKALAKKGGVLGIAAFSLFATKSKGMQPTINNFFDAIDYIVNLVGINHVGIGLDLGPLDTKEWWEKFRLDFPELGVYDIENYNFKGLNNVSCLQDVTEGLLKRGYSRDDIKKILGGNFLRVFEEVLSAND